MSCGTDFRSWVLSVTVFVRSDDHVRKLPLQQGGPAEVSVTLAVLTTVCRVCFSALGQSIWLLRSLLLRTTHYALPAPQAGLQPVASRAATRHLRSQRPRLTLYVRVLLLPPAAPAQSACDYYVITM